MTRGADTDPLRWIESELAALADRDLLRRRTVRSGPSVVVTQAGRQLINFASNDYLSLRGDPRLVEAARAAISAEGAGAGASPLVSGYGEALHRVEERIAAFEGCEAAIVFSSGYAANLGTIPALVGPGDAVYSDELNHASLIDGCRLSRATASVYPHCDMAALARLLADSARFRRRLIVTDGLFSMDGDLAPVADLAELAERHDCLLMVDEAHATGVFGEHGRGVAEHVSVEAKIGVRMGTLSKALGGSGGFVCGTRSLVEWLVNRARPYIFSTALPPGAAAAAIAAIDAVEGEPARRRSVLERAGRVRAELIAQGWDVGRSQSHIVPVIVGDPRRALGLSAELERRGLLVPAIRPPSVPEHGSRLRIGICHGHDGESIQVLLTAMADLRHRAD